mmetsp:Transcript_54914/g.139197  ORF Transcript_54914/g.139197 Transcript_54914/m.139197 type:complete len:387 (+) Transcript_54914:244-1404(+)
MSEWHVKPHAGFEDWRSAHSLVPTLHPSVNRLEWMICLKPSVATRAATARCVALLQEKLAGLEMSVAQTQVPVLTHLLPSLDGALAGLLLHEVVVEGLPRDHLDGAVHHRPEAVRAPAGAPGRLLVAVRHEQASARSGSVGRRVRVPRLLRRLEHHPEAVRQQHRVWIRFNHPVMLPVAAVLAELAHGLYEHRSIGGGPRSCVAGDLGCGNRQSLNTVHGQTQVLIAHHHIGVTSEHASLFFHLCLHQVHLVAVGPDDGPAVKRDGGEWLWVASEVRANRAVLLVDVALEVLHGRGLGEAREPRRVFHDAGRHRPMYVIPALAARRGCPATLDYAGHLARRVAVESRQMFLEVLELRLGRQPWVPIRVSPDALGHGPDHMEVARVA